MSLEVWLFYVAAVLAFMSTPGPSHLLMLSNSMTHGFRPSLATALGDLTANALQMFAAAIGLAAIITASQHALSIIKWLGAAYLLWMGLRMWRQAGTTRAGKAPPKAPSFKSLWLQGFLTSASNPKAVVFFAALFPQFITPDAPFAAQFFALSLTYIVIDGAFLSAYGASADYLAGKLKGRANVFLGRLGGSFLMGAALMLGLKTLKD